MAAAAAGARHWLGGRVAVRRVSTACRLGGQHRRAVATRAAGGGGGGDSTPTGDASPPPPPPHPPAPLTPRVPEHAPVTGRLYRYLLEHTREAPALARLRAETAVFAPGRERNAVSPDQGAFLGWLVGALGVRTALEVGVFTGYSSTAIAAALPADGKLVACEKDERPLVLARSAWEAAGVAGRVDCRVGPAADTLAALLSNPAHGPGSFDFAFIDADKRGYAGYYESCLQLVRVGGVVAIDNVLWYGRVTDPDDATPATAAVRELNDSLLADPRIDLSTVSVGDGIALCRRLV
jgi:O-methyltransferase